jgi:hypothetical protein
VVEVAQDEAREESLPAQLDEDVCQGDAVRTARNRHHADGASQASLLEESAHDID